jgi:predicted cytidylate kinase
MIITISGKPGSGKDTVGKILSEKLSMKFYAMGDLRGELAKKHGITLEELNRIGEKEDWTDKEIDDKIVKMGKDDDNFVVISRTAFFLMPHSVKVFLDVDYDEAAKRIMADRAGRDDEKIYDDVDKEADALRERADGDRARYLKIYKQDYTDPKNFDIVIDTSNITAQQVADKIIKFIKLHMALAVKKALKKENGKHDDVQG